MLELRYDTSFQWGSKRTGPDLSRVGGKYANLWHYLHMRDPRSTSPGSNMPNFEFLTDATVDHTVTEQRMRILRKLGVPYTDEDIERAIELARSQGRLIADDLASGDVTIAPESELVALIAYLQRLGRNPQPVAPDALDLTQGRK